MSSLIIHKVTRQKQGKQGQIKLKIGIPTNMKTENSIVTFIFRHATCHCAVKQVPMLVEFVMVTNLGAERTRPTDVGGKKYFQDGSYVWKT